MTRDEKDREAAGASPWRNPLSLMPGEFWEHFRAGRRQRLLSLRSLFDAAIEHLEDQPEASESPRRSRLIPDAFWEHNRAACREDLLACRSLLDSVIEGFEEKSAPTTKRIEIE